MLVSEVIRLLSKVDPDAILMLSSDEEGNSYRPGLVSINKRVLCQDGEWIVVDEGNYEGREDGILPAVVVW